MTQYRAYIITESERAYQLGDNKDPAKIRDKCWLAKSIMPYMRRGPLPALGDGLREIVFSVESWKEQDIPFRSIN